MESRRSLLDTPQGRVLVVNSRDLSERMSAEKRRAAQARYQKKISRLGQAALSKRNPAELVAKAVQSVLDGLGGGAVAYLERGSGEREVVLRRVAGLASTPADSAVARIETGSLLAPLLEASEPVVLNGPWKEGLPLHFEWLRRYGALDAVPVPADGGPRGIVCAVAEAPGAFGPEETRFLTAAASMVAAALHRLDSEARVAYLAQFDPLTGLPNRTLLADRFSLRRYEKVICVSDDLFQTCRRYGVAENKAVLIENAIDTDQFGGGAGHRALAGSSRQVGGPEASGSPRTARLPHRRRGQP